MTVLVRELRIVACLVALLLPVSAGATLKLYMGPVGVGIWDYGPDWSPAGVPNTGDEARVTQTDGASRTLQYYGPGVMPNPTLAEVRIDATDTGSGFGSILLDHKQGELHSALEYVGYAGEGGYLQEGGQNYVGQLYLGFNAGSSGVYDLQTGLLQGDEIDVGWLGDGAFTQSGGTISLTQRVNVADQGGSTGSYTLSGGTLTTVSEHVGRDGTGTFTQTGGTNTVTNTLWIGDTLTGDGTYTLSGGQLNITADIDDAGLSGSSTFELDGGTLSVGGPLVRVDTFDMAVAPGSSSSWGIGAGQTLDTTVETIGAAGTASFTQSGGTNSVAADLTLGAASTADGSYDLQAGSLGADNLTVGEDGTGSFTQSAGTSSVAGALVVGSNAGASGSYDLGGGELSALSEVAGNGGTASFTQSGGTHSIATSLELGSLATGDGSYTLSAGQLGAGDETIGNAGTGSFIQTGGSHDVVNSLVLGLSSGSFGSYDLSGTSSLTASDAYVGAEGTGIFNQSGGTTTLGGELVLGELAGSNGSYGLSALGYLSSNEVRIGGGGTGSFVNNGGWQQVAADLTLGEDPGSSGSYTLSLGILDVDGSIVAGAGTSALSVDGGLLDVAGSVLGGSGTATFSLDLDSLGHSIGGDLDLGTNAGSTGTYSLLPGGSLLVGGDILKGSGNVTVNVDGGTLSVGGSTVVSYFRVASTGGTSGSHTLGSGQSLSSQGEFSVGLAGTGLFTQNGGTADTGSLLRIGANAAADGTYHLNGGSLVTDSTIIGDMGTGSFTQSGGTHIATLDYGNGLVLGAAATGSGSYDLSGASTLSTQNTRVGDLGDGSFVQSGGTHEITRYLGTFAGNLEVGYGTGSTGSYTLSGGSLSVETEEVIGHGTFTQTGGTNLAGAGPGFNLAIHSAGTYDLGGGQLSVASSEFVDGSFTQSSGAHDVGLALLLGYGVSGGGSYDLGGGSLAVGGDEFIGVVGTDTASFTQSGGTHSVSGSLSVADGAGTSATFDLSAGSLSVGADEEIGVAGTGAFTQSAGTHDVTGGLTVGTGGSYDLGGTGALTVGTSETVDGSFVQSAGTHDVALDLRMGDVTSGGSFQLGGGTLSEGGDVLLGLTGTDTASFTQNGGTHTVTGTLALAVNPGTQASYDLSAGSLSAPTVQLNAGGVFTRTGGSFDFTTFNQDGGTWSGLLDNPGTFNYSGGVFSGRLLNRGTVNLFADFTAGDGLENQTVFDVAAGRTVTLNGSGLDNQGSMAIDGVLQGNGSFVNYGTMTGGGEMSSVGTFANYGFFGPSSGFELANAQGSENYGTIDMPSLGQLRVTTSPLMNAGSVNLNNGQLVGTGSLTNTYGGTVRGPGTIVTPFQNAGGVLLVESGTTNVLQAFTNSGAIQLTAFSANLAGGAITSSGTIEGLGHVGNDVTNTGNIEAIGGTLTLSGSVSNDPAGLIAAGAGSKVLFSNGLATSAGTINLTGGTFDNNGFALTSTGQVSGHGTFRSGGFTNDGSVTLNGGFTTVNGDVTNSANRQFEVVNDAALFTGDVTNYGIFKTTNTTVTFAGTYTENGAFISDPSDNFFQDILLGDTGFLVGGVGDRFFVDGNLLSSSAMAQDWETLAAELIFQGGGAHTLRYTGEDRGASGAGLADNYAWGLLELAAGDTLELEDGDAVAGGAVYVRVLQLGGGVSQIDSITGNGLSIYYDWRESENAYLGGGTYALAGGGFLAPIPEPATAALLAAGLAGLAATRRRGSPA